VWAQNFRRERRFEFFDITIHGTEIERSVFKKVTWRIQG
jgi:hypothetical protein